MMKRASLILVAMLALGGCATYTGWQPVVDPRSDPNPAMIQQDTEECKMLAQQAGSVGTETAKGVAAGGLLGAAAGAAIGAVTGHPGAGAAIGAAAGGIGGGAQTGVTGDEAYKRAFTNCMRNRGHNVIN
jgi:outer membrane lipoprotein SlyB